jgi:hypothetical protein
LGGGWTSGATTCKKGQALPSAHRDPATRPSASRRPGQALLVRTRRGGPAAPKVEGCDRRTSVHRGGRRSRKTGDVARLDGSDRVHEAGRARQPGGGLVQAGRHQVAVAGAFDPGRHGQSRPRRPPAAPVHASQAIPARAGGSAPAGPGEPTRPAPSRSQPAARRKGTGSSVDGLCDHASDHLRGGEAQHGEGEGTGQRSPPGEARDQPQAHPGDENAQPPLQLPPTVGLNQPRLVQPRRCRHRQYQTCPQRHAEARCHETEKGSILRRHRRAPRC